MACQLLRSLKSYTINVKIDIALWNNMFFFFSCEWLNTLYQNFVIKLEPAGKDMDYGLFKTKITTKLVVPVDSSSSTNKLHHFRQKK